MARKRTPERGRAETRHQRRKSAGASARIGIFGFLLKWSLVSVVWLSVLVAGAVGYFAYQLPDISALNEQARRPSVQLLAADGGARQRWCCGRGAVAGGEQQRGENRGVVA